MALRDYEQRHVPELQSALGEPILRAVALNRAGVAAQMFGSAMFWRRPYLLVDGRPYARLPHAVFLTLTPTRVVMTECNMAMGGPRPVLDAPILTLQRSDAEITATQCTDGPSVWRYCLRSRASTAELELELRPFGGIAAELAEQLRAFSNAASTAPSSPSAPLPPGGGRGRFYWDGHGWSPRPRNRLRFAPWMVVVGVFVVISVVYAIVMSSVVGHPNNTVWTPPSTPETPSTSTTIAATTPGGPMNTLFCKHTDSTGAPYYVQLSNPTDPAGTCTGQHYTQEEFEAIPGLTWQCALISDSEIAQMHGIATIYSDGSEGSIEATKLVCA